MSEDTSKILNDDNFYESSNVVNVSFPNVSSEVNNNYQSKQIEIEEEEKQVINNNSLNNDIDTQKPKEEGSPSGIPQMIYTFLFENVYLSFFFGVFLMFLSGTHYAFSSISPTIKSELNLSQIEVNLIGTFGNIGTYFALPISFLNDIFGSKITLFMSSILLFSGYFLFYLVYNEIIPRLENSLSMVVLLCFFMVLMGQGSAGVYAAVATTNIKNFSLKHRGKVIGILGSGVALSSALFSMLYSSFFDGALEGYLLFTSILTGSCVLILGLLFVNQIKQSTTTTNNNNNNKKDDEASVNESINQIKIEESMENEVDEFVHPVDEEEDIVDEVAMIDKVSNVSSDDNENETRSLLVEEQRISSSYTTFHNPKMNHIYKIANTPLKDYNPIQLLLSLDFYILFFIYFAGMGSGLVIINNLGSIVISFGGKDGQQHFMVQLFAVSNCLSRLMFGLVSDRFSKYVTRATFLTGAVTLMLINQLLTLVAPLWFYYLLVILLGIAFGGIAVIGTAIISERYSPKYFAMNNSLLSIASSLGSIGLATFLAGHIYEINIHGHSHGHLKYCYGRECFQITFYITTGLCTAAFALCLILMYRTRGLYRILYYRKVLNVNN
ncbi:hypothetical protein ABK040_007179 [Willaertia magna]